MMLIIQINFLLYKAEASRKRRGSKWKREREREKEDQINGVRDGAEERTRSCIGRKLTLGKRTPEYFK